jgi:peptidoglycan-N-acetylglucosamine deacetylase
MRSNRPLLMSLLSANLSLVACSSPAASLCSNADALGVEREVYIDTTAGPRLGAQQYTDADFLQPQEVILTFDDGPWPVNTPMVLAALTHHCTKATFFPIGTHALLYPDILKQVAALGHTVGGHTWSHPYLSRLEHRNAIDEIEKGFSAVKVATGLAPAPFFRFPFLDDSKASLAHLATRGIATFSTDVDSLDYAIARPEVVVRSVLYALQDKRKGIILLHDFQEVTAKAALNLLDALKAGGYKVVHVKPKVQLSTLPTMDKAIERERAQGAADRPPEN